jgi:hypothetical protein
MRSQKGPNYKLYPTKKPEKKQKTAPIIPPPTKKAPATPATVPPPVPVTTQPQVTKLPKAIPQTPSQPPPSVPVPLPQPPYQNTADAWKENKKNKPTAKKTDNQDVEMQDASKNKGGYHFTSMIQEMAEGDAIQS